MARVAHIVSWFTLVLLTAGCAGELELAFQPEDLEPAGVGGGEPMADPVFYPDIHNDIERFACARAGCHGKTGIHMVLTANPSSYQELFANYQEVVKAADGNVLLARATGSYHVEKAFDVDSPVYVRWARWIEIDTPF